MKTAEISSRQMNSEKYIMTSSILHRFSDKVYHEFASELHQPEVWSPIPSKLGEPWSSWLVGACTLCTHTDVVKHGGHTPEN